MFKQKSLRKQTIRKSILFQQTMKHNKIFRYRYYKYCIRPNLKVF